jgi:serine phosphatase RsbU (regulator of sigma subunit)
LKAPAAKREKNDGVEVLGRNGEPHLVRVVVPFQGEGPPGRVEIGRSIADIADRNRRIDDRVGERQEVAIINALFVGGMIILLGVVLTILQSLRISRPIRELTESVERIAHGDLSERALVDSTDEIGVLGRNFNYMAERLGVLIKETEERATYEKEMEVARIIQESLLPPNRLIDQGYFQFTGYFKSASICGGDWWNYAEISEGRLLVLIGDVTGHGVSSAMITAAAKSCCDTLRHVTDGELTVTFLLEELNKTIYEAANRRFVMTFFATIIDPKRKTLTFSNAGHNFPLLFRARPAEGEPAIVPLITRGNRLGDVMDSRFLERTVPYGDDDVIVWYTDGITEGLGKSGDEYGEKRFRRSIRSALDRPADHILDKILRDAEAFFVDFSRPEDDITLVVGKFIGAST